MKYTESEIKIANKTSRSNGAVGSKALVPQTIRQIVNPSSHILDFGAGKSAIHAESLKSDGYQHVTAYEFGNNVNELHDIEALLRVYDVVYASNVLNVQSSMDMLHNTLSDVSGCCNGTFICNYPQSPRKGVMENISSTQLIEILQQYFDRVEKIGGTKSAPVLICHK